MVKNRGLLSALPILFIQIFYFKEKLIRVTEASNKLEHQTLIKYRAMKSLKCIVAVSMILLIAADVSAQSQRLKIEPGIQIGANFTALTDMAHSYEPGIGFIAGFSVEAGYLGRPFSLQTGLKYYRSNTHRTVENVNTDFVRDYLSLPVTLNYSLNSFGFPGIYFFVGPGINYLVHSEIVFNMGEDTVKGDYSDQTTDMQYFLEAGAGSRFQKGNLNMNFRLQFNVSLNDVYNGEEIDGGRNIGVSLIAGFVF